MDGNMLMWLILAVLFLVVELLTTSLVSIWFVIGAVVALIAASLQMQLPGQIGFFVGVTAVLLIFTMPVARRLTKKDKHATNSDMVIGADAIVTETIDDIRGKGQVKVRGAVWSAKSNDGRMIDVGEKVKVLSIEGVKVIVERKERKED